MYLKRSIANELPAKGKKPRKAAAGKKKCYCPSAASARPKKRQGKQTSPQRHEVENEHDRSTTSCFGAPGWIIIASFLLAGTGTA
jgi:hypothetical protein